MKRIERRKEEKEGEKRSKCQLTNERHMKSNHAARVLVAYLRLSVPTAMLWLVFSSSVSPTGDSTPPTEIAIRTDIIATHSNQYLKRCNMIPHVIVVY